MRNKAIKFILIIILAVIIGCGLFLLKKRDSTQPLPIEPEIVYQEPVTKDAIQPQETPAMDTPSKNEVKTEETRIKDSVLIKVPFLVQAPFANWDSLHEDACEEASLIMINHYYKKNKIQSTQEGENEILNMIEYENRNNYGPSISLKELSQIAKNYLGLNNARIEVATKENILKELNQGKPVIIPAAGKLLDNPNFRNGGPNYHMLVITGYDKNGFITNDPGTRKGENFRYSYDNILNAIHDWDSKDINQGEKLILVFD